MNWASTQEEALSEDDLLFRAINDGAIGVQSQVSDRLSGYLPPDTPGQLAEK